MILCDCGRCYSPLHTHTHWRQRADERLGDPLPSFPGAFIGQRQEWKVPSGQIYHASWVIF